ncbi:MAG: LuxR C-terminal-related transcriptional regulator [Gaiellaceae bacterium]
MNGVDTEAPLARESRAPAAGREQVKRALRQAVLADAHPMWLESVAQILKDGEMAVAAKTSPGDDALAALEELRPDVLVTELLARSGELDAGAYIHAARACSPDTKIVVLAAAADRQTVHDMLLAGADAYVIKTARPEDLLAAVRQTFEGSVFLAPAELLRSPKPVPVSLEVVPEAREAALGALTRRETQILRLMAEGLTNVQVARQLWLSEQTVKFHLSNIYRKLGVSNRTEASRWAQLNGLLAA